MRGGGGVLSHGPQDGEAAPGPRGDFFTISNPLLSSIPPRWEDPDTVAAMAELLDGLTYQPAAEESAESQTMALSLIWCRGEEPPPAGLPQRGGNAGRRGGLGVL